MKLNRDFTLSNWVRDGLEKLPDNIKSKFQRRLTAENNFENFKALESELKFGIILNKISDCMFSDQKINSLTPDWTVELNSLKSIFEVYRLGKSNKDSQIDILYYLVHDKISKLPYDCFVKILIADNCVGKDTNCIEGEDIMSEISEWLASNHKTLHSSKVFGNLITLTVIKVNTGRSYTLCTHGVRIIDQKPHKLVQQENLRDNEITKKLNKYANIILEHDLPYFLCVDIDFASGFHYDDFVEYFHHSSTDFIDYDSERDFIPGYGRYWSVLGEFYNLGTRTCLSGILIIENNVLRVLMNPNKYQRIYLEKFEDLLDKVELLDNLKLFDMNISNNALKLIEDINRNLKTMLK